MFNINEFANFISKKFYGVKFAPYKIKTAYLSAATNGAFVVVTKDYPVGNPDECYICINKSLIDRAEYSKEGLYELISAVCHEITHFGLWYLGYDYSDESKEFLKKAEEIGFYDNYDLYDLNTDKLDSYYNEFISQL